ncbi:MAG: hypothetical protein Q8O43_03360 [Dehalococcoidia bacterium]|nr:hypothetical protein [Dehalococcoidia bacterium]
MLNTGEAVKKPVDFISILCCNSNSGFRKNFFEMSEIAGHWFFFSNLETNVAG